MPKLIAVPLALVVVTFAVSAAAQVACDASCSAVIDVPASGVIDGSDASPGAVVCLRTNSQPVAYLQLSSFHGLDGQLITVRPCGSTLEVGTAQSGSLGIEIHDSQHLRFTGDGGAVPEAVHVQGGASGGPGIVMGIGFSGCSSDVELDHLEVAETSYTALRNHVEEPSCPVRSGFSVHDNHFHDLGGEGMFQAINDPASPYRVANVSVRHNHIERAGFQGIKIGVTVDGCLIEGNLVVDSGYAHTAGEDTGLALGAGCTVRGNVVLRSSADLVFVRGSGNSYVFENNVFSGNTPTMTFQGGIQDLSIAHNTMVGSSAEAVTLYGDAPVSARLVNNLIVGAAKPSSLVAGPALSLTGNLEIASVDAALFATDATANEPYALTAGSPAVDAGVVVEGVTNTDFLGRARDAKPDAGAEEYGASLPGAGGAGGGGGAVASSPSSSATSGATTTAVGAGGAEVAPAPGGCALSSSARATDGEGFIPTAMGAVLILAGLMAARRSRTNDRGGR